MRHSPSPDGDRQHKQKEFWMVCRCCWWALSVAKEKMGTSA